MESGSIGSTYRKDLQARSEKTYPGINFIAQNSIEHRILYLLEFKRAVFNGVLEQEGNDEVMLEGFMESVRAMTGVVLNNEYSSTTSEKINEGAGMRNITDVNTESDPVIVVNTDQKAPTLSQNIQNTIPEKTDTGFFNKIRHRIISFLKGFTKNQQK